MSYSMLTSIESSEAGTTSVHIACLALTLARRIHSVVSRRGLKCPRKSGCASHDIHCYSTCKIAGARGVGESRGEECGEVTECKEPVHWMKMRTGKPWCRREKLA